MIQTYTFFGEEPLAFDDRKSVRKLIRYAFDTFGYYEPAGMEIVTIFQCHHTNSCCGWFTTDTSRKCVEEIENPDRLCFGYYKPGAFYFAEGGWGHHMPDLGNHPVLEDPVALSLRFEDFNHTVMINGNYCFRDIIRYLRKTGYISDNLASMEVLATGKYIFHPLRIDFSDPVMDLKLTDFEKEAENRAETYYAKVEGFIYYLVFVLE